MLTSSQARGTTPTAGTGLVVGLLGHRATGKTTMAREVARALRWRALDLDQALQARWGRAPAEWLGLDPVGFRLAEAALLEELVATCDGPTVLSIGAGCERYPEALAGIWLWREGWETSALQERARLRPELAFVEEVAWMRAEREPRYARAAWLRVDLERGWTRAQHVALVAGHVAWLWQISQHSHLGERSWVVPGSREQFGGACQMARLLGLGGVEVRSDLLCETTPRDLVAQGLDARRAIASVRHGDAAWVRGWAEAAVVDVDLAFGPAARSAAGDRRFTGELVLSCHPPRADAGAVEALKALATTLAPILADQGRPLGLKFAPAIAGGVQELREALALERALRAWTQERGMALTFLPQGARWAWLRPLLAARGNRLNYISVGVSWPGGPPVGPAPWALQEWLSHLVGEEPKAWDALVGDPVAPSLGDVWHRQAALREGSATGYVKVAVPREEPGALEATLGVLHALGVRGLSVTSPFKREVLALQSVRAESGGPGVALALTAANTLRREATGWLACDTDRAGMEAALAEVEAMGHGPGRAVILGQGGVSPALVAALEQRGWLLVAHVGARQGWQAFEEVLAAGVDLVINAAGPGQAAHQGAPSCKVWLDVHYRMAETPARASRHVAGWTFFEAQARAQRHFWALPDAEP